jgi:hypothetical protein
MPPAASKRESILDNIVSTLEAIVTGSDYNYTPGEVRLGLRHQEELPKSKFPAYFVAGADEKRKNHAQREYTSDMEVAVVGYVFAADAADEELLERQVSRAIADITRALMVDVTRGGYAVTTEVGDIDTTKGALLPLAGFEILVNVKYRANVATP